MHMADPHNANDDEDDDEDGYQDPTSLLEQSRYDGDGGIRLNGDDAGYHHQQQQQQYAAQQPNQQQTLSQAQIEFLKSMVGFRKKWTPYELRTCNEIRHIIGSREYDSLRKNDGMPLPSVKTLRKYRNTEPVPEEVEVVGRKRKHHEMMAEESGGVGGGGTAPVPGAGGQHKTVAAEAYGEGRLFPFGNDAEKAMMKAEHDSEDGHFDVSVLTMAQISFLQTLTLNTKGFSDYELQRSLELKNELGSKNYETLRKQEFLNIPTLVMLTRYEQDNGLEDLSRMAGGGPTVAVDDDDEPDGRGDAASVELVSKGGQRNMVDAEEEHNLELLQQKRQQEEQLEEERAREQQQQEQQQQLELYNRLTQADLTRHPLFDSIAGDSSPGDGSDSAATAAAMAVAMAAAAAGIHPSYDLNGTTGDDSSLGIFENHSIFDKDSPTFDMSKLSPAHVEFLNTLPENPKRWTQEMINSALDIKNEIGTRDYEILRRQGIPLPAARTLRRHKDIRNKADRAVSEPGEILPGSGATAGVVGSG
ncbi:AGAP013434-PA-like protein [Anopheles sinensis]|uniref:AGAP013434-PA-like protein n=1 Tax=Anopheles sinensis TaxID=74873 RepID=A0A084VTV3_ANOSI|nr:AGAP013434-PA-like protein [Anopheles sinensis]